MPSPLPWNHSLFFSPEAFPLFLVFNRVIQIAERYVEKLPTVALTSQNLLDSDIRNHIHVAIFVNKSNNTVVIRVLHFLFFRLKSSEINDLMATELRPVYFHLVFHFYSPFFDFANIHDFLSAPLGLDFLRSPFYFI